MAAPVQAILADPVSYTIWTPTYNTERLDWASTGIELAAGESVRVFVQGYLYFSPNTPRQEYPLPPSMVPPRIGPTGIFGAGPAELDGRVRVRVRELNGATRVVHWTPNFEPQAETVTGAAVGPGLLEVSRNPVGEGLEVCDPTCGLIADYVVSGRQLLRVEPVVVPPPVEHLVVAIDLGTSALSPVYTPAFDAVRQVFEGGRDDTTSVEVRLAYAPSARPAVGARVTVRATVVEGSGGHVHDTVARPLGALYEDNGDTQSQGRGTNGDVIQFTVAGGTVARFRYRSSGVGGDELIIVTATDGMQTAIDTARVRVSETGLVELANTGAIDTIGVTADHPDSHWGTPEMVARLRVLADSMQQLYRQPLEVNDISLPFGGVFDLVKNWRPDHVEHRRGRSADIRTVSWSAEEQEDIARIWSALNATLPRRVSVYDERGSSRPHFHLRTAREQ